MILDTIDRLNCYRSAPRADKAMFAHENAAQNWLLEAQGL